MKTLVQICQELGKTPQAAYKRMAHDAALADVVKKGSVKSGRSVLLTTEAESALKAAFSSTKSDDKINEKSGQNLIVELLREQLNSANEQIRTLQQLLNQQQQISLNQQLLLSEPKRRGISSWFRRNRPTQG